jgi:hypothetical protein
MLLLALPRLHAQTESATLSGVVADAEGARIPGATIVLSLNNSHDTRKTVSNDEGVYNFAALPPGTYVMNITRTGFAGAREMDIVLHPADSRTLNVTLAVGTLKTEIVVSSNDQANTSGERSALISANDIQHLSVEGRDVSELVKTLPGFAIVQPNQLANGAYDPGQVTVGGGLSNFSANGAPTSGLNITSNGADITDPTTGNTTTQNINQEMVSEVKIQTSAFGADQAKGPIVVNVVGKSGGATYHGAIYTYFRTHQLDTQNWFSKNQGLQDAPDRYLYPGANIGGPVKLPFTNFNRSKRLTFFVGAEDYVQRNVYAYGNSLNSYVLALLPTANMRTGNFSPAELANYLGTDITTLANQCSTTGSLSRYIHLCGVPSGSTNDVGGLPSTVGSTVNGGIIPAGGMDPGATALLNSLPLPNRPTLNGFNYIATNFENNDLWQLSGRLDEAASDKLKISLSYNVERGRTTGIPEVMTYSPANGGAGMGGIDTPGKSVARVFTQSLSLNATYIFSSTMTNEFFASAALNRNDFNAANASLLQASTIGYTYSGIYPGATRQYPQFGDYSFDGLPIALYPDFSAGPFYRHTFTPTIGDNLTKVWRTHTLKFGVYVQRAVTNGSASSSGAAGSGGTSPQTNGIITQYYLPNGTKITNPDNTQGNTLYAQPACNLTGQPLITPCSPAQASASGNYLADFAIGDVTQFYQQNAETNLDLYFWNIDFFGTDTWKVTPRLTLTAGLRFDHLGPWQDAHGNGIAIFSQALYANPVNQEYPGLDWHGIDSTVPNSGSPGRAFFYSPRFGIAYDLHGDSRTVISGGFGLYRSHDSGNDYAQAAATAQGIFTTTVGGGGVQLTKLTPTIQRVSDCTSATIGGGSSKCPTLNAYVYALDRNDTEQPLTYTYNFTISQRAYKNSRIDIAYSGSQSHNLLLEGALQNVDALPIGALFAPDPITHTVALPQSLSAGQEGDFRPYRPYSAVDMLRHLAYSNYNALQASWNRNAAPLRFGVNYTFSKSLGIRSVPGLPADPIYLRNNYGPLNSDRSQIFNATYSYEFGNHVFNHRLLTIAASGWEVSGITGLQSGPNLQATYSANFKLNGIVGANPVLNTIYLGTPDVSLQPMLTCDPSKNLQAKQYVNGACFQLPSPGLQNGPMNFPYLHGPAYFNTDLTVGKSFHFADSRSLQLRLAGFNFLNHPITSFSGRVPNEANLYFAGTTPTTATLPATTGNCSVIGSNCFGYAGYKQGRRVVEISAKFNF